MRHHATDRKLAERKLKDWLAELAITEGTAANVVLSTLLESYKSHLGGKAVKTRKTRFSILSRLKETWKHGEKMRVTEVRSS